MRAEYQGLCWVGLAGALAVACASDSNDCTETQTCGAGQGGTGGIFADTTSGGRRGMSGGAVSSAGGAVMSAPQCQKASDIDDPDGEFVDVNCDGIDGDKTKAIFVSPLGVDTANGAFGAPVKSIAKGVTLALAAKKEVYVCQGNYAENLVLEGSVNLKVHGGYDCAGWKRSNQRPVVNPAAGVPLRVKNVVGEVLMDRLHFKAADATELSGSSIAIWASDSRRVSLVQVRIEAGRGNAGLPGAVPTLDPGKPPSGSNGYPPNSSSCTASTCPGGSSFRTLCPSGFSETAVRGGAGGDGDSCSGGGAFCVCNGVSSPARNGHQGVPVTTSTLPDGKDGRPGLAGAMGPSGAAAAARVGDANVDGGYVPSNRGAQGGFGLPGQSGEGGDGAGGSALACGWLVGPSGGQGGRGGCGGEGGLGGQGGGASLGLLSLESEVDLAFCEVITKDGGEGGQGGSGGPGEKGADGGLPGAAPAGKGGLGGQGGPGGTGGPGGGGPSIGVFAVGIAPSLNQLSFAIGVGGRGALALPGTGSGDAATGLSADYWPVNIRPVANGAAGSAGQGGL